MALLKRWIEAACWTVLRWVGAECPTCATPVARSLDLSTAHCQICGKRMLGTVLKQHDGRIICQRHKAGVY